MPTPFRGVGTQAVLSIVQPLDEFRIHGITPMHAAAALSTRILAAVTVGLADVMRGLDALAEEDDFLRRVGRGSWVAVVIGCVMADHVIALATVDGVAVQDAGSGEGRRVEVPRPSAVHERVRRTKVGVDPRIQLGCGGRRARCANLPRVYRREGVKNSRLGNVADVGFLPDEGCQQSPVPGRGVNAV